MFVTKKNYVLILQNCVICWFLNPRRLVEEVVLIKNLNLTISLFAIMGKSICMYT